MQVGVEQDNNCSTSVISDNRIASLQHLLNEATESRSANLRCSRLPIQLSSLAQAVADGLVRVRLKKTDNTNGFKKTTAGGCFKQGKTGKFIRKSAKVQRYVPSFTDQPAEGCRSFRPKETLADLRRSNSLLQRTVGSQRAQFIALQNLKAAPVLSARDQHESTKLLANAQQSSKQLKAQLAQVRQERNAARGELQTSQIANAELLQENQRQIAQVEFQCQMDIKDAEEQAQASIRKAESQAMDDKEAGIAKAKESTERYRAYSKKMSKQASRAQSKLERAVAGFEDKAAAVKSRSRRDVTNLLGELTTLVTSSEHDRKRSDRHQAKLQAAVIGMQAELEVQKQPIGTMKNNRDFSDEIVLLTWELMAMGVSSNIVGDVEALCCEHLAHRKLERKPSKSTAGRWALQSKDISMHHLGELLCKNAERGIGYATDTTTVRAAERAANNFELRLEDGSVLKLRGPVTELASHTAAEQMEHNVQHILSDTRRVLKSAGIVRDCHRVSVAYFVRVMGDHVNEALWDLVEAAKFEELDQMIVDQSISAEIASQMRMFSRNKCSKHKLAKLSRDACTAMGKLQDTGAAKFSNMVPKGGRTYESLGYKLTEVVAWQFSCDISVANPHGHAQDFQDWQDMMEQTPMAIFNINKNRHYRHEKGARKVLLHVDEVLEYLADVRDGRDEKEHPNKFTKLGNADSRIWTALHMQFKEKHHMEAYAQLCAMDMLDCLFFSPALCMICAPTTDVINVGKQWRVAYDWLTATVGGKTDAELMVGGREHRCFPLYHKIDKGQAQDKTPLELEFQPPVVNKLVHLHDSEHKFQDRVMQYFRAATVAMAKGATEIAKEYFPAEYNGLKIQDADGALFDPSTDVIQKLSGFICENDFCEQQLGDERLALTRAAGKISMTAVGGLNMMKHNNVVRDIRSGSVVNIVHLRGKLYKERRRLEGSEKEKRVKMRSRVEEYRAVKRVEVMQRSRNRAVARAETEAVEQFLTKAKVEALLSTRDTRNIDVKLKSVKDQLKIYRDLLEYGYKAVRMSYTKDVPAPGGRIKKKKITGQALLEWLCGQLLKLMAETDQADGKVKPWRDVLGSKGDTDWSQAATSATPTARPSAVVYAQSYMEECEDHVSDDDVSAAGTTPGHTVNQHQSLEAASNAQELDAPAFEELAADEEGESDEEYEPQTILNERLRRNKMQYLVQWRGFKKSEATWEPEAHIQSCSDIIKAWQEKIMQSMSKSSNNKKAASKKRGRPP